MMCEFCTKHGEGKKWYLQMKNYADDLFYEELTATQKDMVRAATRLEWNNRFWESFVMPAIRGVSTRQVEPFAAETTEGSKVEHFGKFCRLRMLNK